MIQRQISQHKSAIFPYCPKIVPDESCLQLSVHHVNMRHILFTRIDFVSESLKRNPLPRQALREELPSGWKKIESRTKPGAGLG